MWLCTHLIFRIVQMAVEDFLRESKGTLKSGIVGVEGRERERRGGGRRGRKRKGEERRGRKGGEGEEKERGENRKGKKRREER